jgi:predicted Zn-ribbon and HTH transcriptional regulator
VACPCGSSSAVSRTTLAGCWLFSHPPEWKVDRKKKETALPTEGRFPRLQGFTRWAFEGFTGWTSTLRTVMVEAEGEQEVRSIQRSKLPAGMSSVPSLERAAVSIWCPGCQSDQIRRSKTRGIVESILAFLLIRPYRCEECDYRFFRWSIRHKPKATQPARTTNARDYELLTPREASHGGNTPYVDMD